MLIRSMLRFKRFKSFIPTCPPPKIDTGCTFCELPTFPEDKAINMEANLNNTKVLPWKHVLNLGHGFRDFDKIPSKIEFIPNSLHEKFQQYKKLLHSQYPPMISKIILNNHDKILHKYSLLPGDQLVYLYPDSKVIKFKLEHTKEFVRAYLVPQDADPDIIYNPFVKTKKQVEDSKEEVDMSLFEEFPIEKDLILVCGHTQRDIRCGKLAPLIRNELTEVSEAWKLDVDIGLISHIGGHAYAGNLIILPKSKSEQIVWYGRVFPQNVQGIVEETLLNKRIIKDLYRGVV